MSRGANLSILGLYNNDPSIFDFMAFPDGFTDAQKQNVKDNILVECAEFEFLYPSPIVAKNVIGLWSNKEKPYWDRVYRAAQAEYNPIENYRRNETESVTDGRTEEHSGNDVSRASGSDTNSRTGTETTDHDADHRTIIDETNVDTQSGSDSQSGSSSSTDTNSGTDVVTNKTSGYDSNTLVDHDSSETAHGHVVTNAAQGTSTTNYGKVDSQDHDAETTETHDDTDKLTLDTLETFVHGKTDTLTHGEKIEHEGNSERTMLAYGNIGVTTSQEMLTQELELAKIIQVVPIIIRSFIDRFCLEVY